MADHEQTPHSVAPKKAFGQNFLTDKHYLRRICAAVGAQKGQTVLELGAGTGALTRALLESGAHVVCVEKDDRCIPVLADMAKEFAANQLTVIEGDALEVNFATLAPKGSMLCGNLPYNIGTELVMRGVATGDHFQKHTYLLQKEVVHRIAAKPNTNDWGRLAIACQLQAHCDNLFDVPPGAFFPAPKVTSAVVAITPLSQQQYPCDRKKLEYIARAAFGQRRKMLRASLKGVLTEDQLQHAHIDPARRPETLSLEEFCRLAALI